jgi:hypothetical protein
MWLRTLAKVQALHWLTLIEGIELRRPCASRQLFFSLSHKQQCRCAYSTRNQNAGVCQVNTKKTKVFSAKLKKREGKQGKKRASACPDWNLDGEYQTAPNPIVTTSMICSRALTACHSLRQLQRTYYD